MVTVWGRNNSINVQKVLWALAELELPFERKDVGGAFGGLDTPEYGALNPHRRIPVLQDGDTVVWESNACVRYLAARYGAGGLWPEDPSVRARSDMWMDWVNSTIIPGLTVTFWGLIRTPAAERNDDAIGAASIELGRHFSILDEHLATHAFVLGTQLSIGDIVTGAACYRYLALPLERPVLTHIKAYQERLAGRGGYREHVMLPLS